MLIFLLTSPILLIGQTYIGFGMGAGVSSILGAEGEVFNIDIEHASDYGLKKRLALSAFHARYENKNSAEALWILISRI